LVRGSKGVAALSPKLRKALCAAGNYWTSPLQVGSHHLARSLVARGWEVAYISDPISPWHLLGGVDLKPRAALYRQGGVHDLDGHLWAYVPGALAVPANQPLLRSEWLHRSWQRLTVPNVARFVKQHGFGEVDLLLMDSFSQPFWLDVLQVGRSVFRIVDRLDKYPKSTQAAKAAQAHIAGAVDFVIYTAQALEPFVRSMKPQRAVHFPNGLEFRHFVGQRWSCPLEYAGIPRPIVVYVGALDHRFDSELVMQAADQLPTVSFVLIGPEMGLPPLRSLPNLYLLGPKQYAKMPAYLQHADVGMIPFNVREHPEHINGIHPLKLYQYLACGLQVVSVAWQELETLNAPVYLARDAEQFILQLQQAVKNEAGADERVAFAEQADWSKRVETLLTLLGLE
jgi:glycosyltransferase involved in cell wall biosynthesis